jgi:hypothetical protein
MEEICVIGSGLRYRSATRSLLSTSLGQYGYFDGERHGSTALLCERASSI